MSDNNRAKLVRQNQERYIHSLAYRPAQASKDQLRAMAAEALRNTAALSIPAPPVPIYPFGKTRSEHGGGSA
jgi:hypothetical protein